MSHPANDNFSLHDDEELSLHDDASLDGSVPATNKGDAPAKLPVLQKDDYDTWAMEMEHYLEYIDNEVWKVIQNGNSKKRVTKGKDGVYRVLPSSTQEEQFAEEKERKARTLLLMAIPKDHLRPVLKQQFEAFTISSKESLEKGTHLRYDNNDCNTPLVDDKLAMKATAALGPSSTTISFPNHLTSGIKDAFSSNFPDLTPASPDYVPALPGKTYSSSSNSFGVVPMVSPTLSLFHDDPYMKVMQAFYAEKSHIPPPTIIPQSSMLNP
ncbi:hypothetical protein Tco_0555459 [Tanacetum coccineum]